ncbi:MAG: double-strand break repair protein AddB, partial [Methylocystis sp.]|nr:double-strand break repair protein AddB [Methylocystis sp.]
MKTFVDAFLAGEIVPSVARASGPLALARTTIYVPTRRAARALVAEFSQAFDGGATLLPRVLPLGGIEERENAALFSERQNAGDEALAPPIEELERRLLLSQLILQWSRALERAIISVDPTGAPNLHESEPLLVASTPASAYALAKDLGALIDEFIIEDIAPDNIKNLSDEAFDQYWAITTHFLDIALKEWPAILAERGRVDAAMRQKRLIETQIDELKKDGGPPVIALGSTGAQPTTARLLAAIAARENGAVILPGLDQAMSDAAWARIGEGGAADSPAFTHPQTMLKRLLQTMGVDRREPRELARLSDALSARRALVAQAMLPPDETTAWRDYRATAGDQFARALAGVTLVEAPDDRLEALTLALFMREALETPDATVALVTPDKNIARRVTAELRRFEIDIDDSGGKPLAATPLGALARLIARIGVEGLRAVNLAALLAHPLASFGLGRARVASLSPILEAGVLRIVGYSAQDLAATVEAARELSKAPHAHPAARRIDEEQWRAIEDLVVRINAVFASFAALGAHASLRQLAETHRNALEGVIAGAEFAEEEGAGPLFELFQRLAAAEAPPEFDAQSYAAFFDDLGFETILRGPRRAHPRLKILGPLEARLIDAKLILL